MTRRLRLSLVFLSAFWLLAAAVPNFTVSPVLVKSAGDGYEVQFTLSEAADVEVSIISMPDSQIIRRLAAGRLGPNAPAPFALDVLNQAVPWDGLDDLGNAVAAPISCVPRVRAAMVPVLDTIVGEQHYKFHRCIGGLATNDSGALFAFGSYPRPLHHGTCMMTLREYDTAGDYVKTLWPVPAGLNPSSVGPYGILNLPGNTYLPKTEAVDVPQFGGTPMSYEDCFLMPRAVDNALLLYDRMQLRYYLVNSDGSVLDTGRIVKKPVLPTINHYYGPWYSGPVYLSLSPDKKYFLLTGYYQINNPTFSAWSLADTGMWCDGRVFRIDRATGEARAFISIPLDSMPKTDSARRATIGPVYGGTGYMAAFHGTAFDDSGRVFVCDRFHDEIGVYDTTGLKLGAIPVTDPDVVEINRKTGAVYVLTRSLIGYLNGTARLLKFADWRSGGGTPVTLNKLAFTLSRSQAVESERSGGPNTYGRLSLAVDNSGEKAVLWINGFNSGANMCADDNLTNIRAVRDDGNAFTVVHDFAPRTKDVNTGFDRVAVDRRTETVYYNDSWDEAWKVENWKAPVPVRCSTSAGEQLSGADFYLSPDGYFYVKEFGYPAGPIKRYSTGHFSTPVPFAGLGTATAVASVAQHYGAGTSDRGFAVDKKGRIFVMNGSNQLQVYDTTGALLKDSLIKPIGWAGGVRLDGSGGLYVGLMVRSPSHVIPTEYANYWPWVKTTGAVVKFNADSGGGVDNPDPYSSDAAGKPVRGSLKVYPQPLSPFTGCMGLQVYVPSGVESYCCNCRTPRFDVDPYGRIFSPHTVAGRVYVADNAGNDLALFGEYGNVDSRGPGSLVPGPSIPLAWPAGVAASDDFIYVTDLVNARLLRIRMDYGLDNMPGLSTRKGVTLSDGPFVPDVIPCPNPFNASVVLRVTLPPAGRQAALAIYDVSGTLVRSLALPAARYAKPYVQSVLWDGFDASGNRVPSGVYLCRYQGERFSKSLRLCYVR